MNNSAGVGINLSNHSSLAAAAQAAAQINAQLAAEGKIQQTQLSYPQVNHTTVQKKETKKTKTGRKDLYNAEVEINDLPPRVRNLLTKGYIQEQIQWKSKAALCTKGRYIAPRDKGTTVDERPLYICIQAIEKAAVDEAIYQIQQFITEHTNGSSPTPPAGLQPIVPNHPPPQVIPLIKDKVYISLDHAPENFKLVERVLGPGGDNVSYIQTETNVNVSLQGRGTNHCLEEPLHLLLEHIDPGAVANARSLALSLVGTLAQDFVQWQREQQLQMQQQQQQQQQFVYTFSQPYFNGPTTGNYHYPALATTMVYGHNVPSMDHNLSQAGRDSQQHQNQTSERDLAPKRPSRFDYQQPPGTNSPSNHSGSSESMAKRPKMIRPPYH